jgi:hypothetical protein
MRGEYGDEEIDSIRRALRNYVEIHHKVEGKRIEEINKILKEGEYDKYKAALYVLGKTITSGYGVLDLLLQGNNSPEKRKTLIGVLEANHNIKVNTKDSKK